MGRWKFLKHLAIATSSLKKAESGCIGSDGLQHLASRKVARLAASSLFSFSAKIRECPPESLLYEHHGQAYSVMDYTSTIPQSLPFRFGLRRLDSEQHFVGCVLASQGVVGEKSGTRSPPFLLAPLSLSTHMYGRIPEKSLI